MWREMKQKLIINLLKLLKFLPKNVYSISAGGKISSYKIAKKYIKAGADGIIIN